MGNGCVGLCLTQPRQGYCLLHVPHLVTIELGDGATARFGTDAWLPSGTISSFAPSLFRAVGRRCRGCTVKDALFQRQWVRDISGALTIQVLCDYVNLLEKLENIQLRPLEADRFIWRWTDNGQYSASSAYRSLFVRMSLLVGAKQVWRAIVPPNVEFFF